MGDSGAAALASSRANLERGSQDYNGYMNRLQGLGQEANQANASAASMIYGNGQDQAHMRYGYGQDLAQNQGQQAGYAVQQGQQVSGLEDQYTQLRAGNRINFGNAMASNRSTGINNLLNAAGTIASAVSGMPKMGGPSGGPGGSLFGGPR